MAEAILNGGVSRELRTLRRELDLHLMLRRSMHDFQQADYSRLVDLLNDPARQSLSQYSRDEAWKIIWRVCLQQPRLIWLRASRLARCAIVRSTARRKTRCAAGAHSRNILVQQRIARPCTSSAYPRWVITRQPRCSAMPASSPLSKKAKSPETAQLPGFRARQSASASNAPEFPGIRSIASPSPRILGSAWKRQTLFRARRAAVAPGPERLLPEQSARRTRP